LFDGNQMVLCPFPDTPRLLITSAHEDAFVRVVKFRNEDPNKYKLHYARYHVISVARGINRDPKVYLAHAYSYKSETNIYQNFLISYTTVTWLPEGGMKAGKWKVVVRRALAWSSLTVTPYFIDAGTPIRAQTEVEAKRLRDGVKYLTGQITEQRWESWRDAYSFKCLGPRNQFCI
jgi:hypothetical protein